ncbi:MAG: DEAD/DEAH box helicase [Acidimicrobiia bacterium]
MSALLDDFWRQLPFEPDDFQVEAGDAIAEGNSVVVTAPTGAGKTLVAEAAIHLALSRGERAFYTTPIKALSNQKYSDLVATHGPERVGLLTGDNVINGDAEIVVMTTEVLRNMIYAESGRLGKVGLVILDEVHYLQDPTRGAVWEEVIIHAPAHLQLVCLSATVSNNQEFAAWVGERRGPTRLIATDHRPVPLESMYMIRDRMGSQTLHMLPTFVEREGRRRSNPRIEHMLGLERGRRRRFKSPNRIETVERLAEEGMLPAIFFIFSRAGCDAAAHRLAEAGVRLTDATQRAAIREIAEIRTGHLGDQDLMVLGYDRWMAGLEAGVAPHHAGLVPAFKETVEELFEAGLLKVVFATETLALGINMPARTVVLESLSKFNGETHELMRPGDYTQLTGRAGRRGIDVEGYGVVLHSPFVRFDAVTEIASIGSHPLRSSFRPTYNMTANLVANYRQGQAEELLEASFAAFQREGDKHSAETTIEALEHTLEKEMAAAHCERGDVEEYLALVETATPGRPDDRISSTLGAGQVIDVKGGSRDGRYLILKRLARKDGGARYLVLATSGRVSTIGYRDIVDGSTIAGELEVPLPVRPKDRRYVQDLMRALRRLPPRESTKQIRKHPVIDHPVAGCPDASRHLAAARRAQRTRRKLEQYRSARRSAGHGLVEEFGAIRQLLGDLDYLEGWELTPRGQRLRGIYNESDLLLAESLEQGVFHDLEAAELAALTSAFVYEPRTDSSSLAEWPTAALAERWGELERISKDLVDRERALRIAPTRKPDPGFGVPAHEWASGVEFDDLSIRGMAPGDFVRVSRQLVDLIRQLRDSAPGLREDAIAALKAIDRGVVAAQGVG